MNTDETNYSDYLAALSDLTRLPKLQNDALNQASQLGLEALRMAESRERQVKSNWENIARKHQALLVETSRLAHLCGATPVEQVAFYGNSDELLKDIRRMQNECDSLNSSWSFISNEQHKMTSQSSSLPPVPMGGALPQTPPPTTIGPSDKSKKPLVAVVCALAAVLVVVLVIMLMILL